MLDMAVPQPMYRRHKPTVDATKMEEEAWKAEGVKSSMDGLLELPQQNKERP